VSPGLPTFLDLFLSGFSGEKGKGPKDKKEKQKKNRYSFSVPIHLFGVGKGSRRGKEEKE